MVSEYKGDVRGLAAWLYELFGNRHPYGYSTRVTACYVTCEDVNPIRLEAHCIVSYASHCD